MATGTPFHPCTAPLNKSLAWRHWGGYFAASCYDDFHQPEYAAIRNGAAVIDVSPLLKYRISGRDAATLLDRVVTRDISKFQPGRVLYTPWCDDQGKMLQEGTLLRFDDNSFQFNAAEPALGWLHTSAHGLEVEIEDRSASQAALAVQGPRSRALLQAVCAADIEGLKFFRHTRGILAGAEVVISRTGFTGDLGYELWLDAEDAPSIWQALMAAAPAHGARPCGMLAMDISRVEAGFILIGVDYQPAEQVQIPSQLSSPYELGLGWAVKLDKQVACNGHQALAQEQSKGSAWSLVGLEIAWEPLEELYASAGLMPELPSVAWRDPVPVYAEGRQVGRATSGCWSSLLKKYIALASVETHWSRLGSELEMEITVDYSRRRAPARVVETPFFRPERMRA